MWRSIDSGLLVSHERNLVVATAMVVLTAGGEGILDSQQWLRPIPKAGPDEEGEKKKVDESEKKVVPKKRTKPTTATQKEEQIKSLLFQLDGNGLGVFPWRGS